MMSSVLDANHIYIKEEVEYHDNDDAKRVDFGNNEDTNDGNFVKRELNYEEDFIDASSYLKEEDENTYCDLHKKKNEDKNMKIKEELPNFEDIFASNPSQNPWPHLDNYFLFKSRVGDKLIFKCKLCLPKSVPIKGHITSLSNLKQHIKRTHPGDVIQFEETIKAGATRGKAKQRFSFGSSSSTSVLSSVFSPPAAKKARYQAIGDSIGITDTVSDVSQDAVDQRIVDLFVANMLPFHVVESDTFVNLIKTLNPSKSSISKRTLCKRIVNPHADIKQYLIRVLGDVQWVATTADCWSVHKKGYLGMTVQWLDPTTRQRQQAVLACIRLTGHHTYDVIRQTMVNVYYEFHIEKKITRTTTDNGRNFVKDFVQFGAETVTSFSDLSVVQDANADPDGDAVAALLTGSMDEQEFEYISLADSLSVPEAEPDNVDRIVDNLINLPTHLRCAAHTFHIVASKDADAALHSAVFKGPYIAAMAKARALWNLHDRSTVAANSIYAEVGRRLVVPNTARWNSTYDSVVVLNTILETKKSALHRVMTQLKVNNFNDQDMDLMKEYTKVMSPVAKALEKIQEEDQAYLGTLLPVVAVTVLKLKDLKSKGLIYCSPLIDALLAGIDKRFGLLMEDEECQLAAAFHPRFRLIWLEKYDNTKVFKVRKSMEDKVEMVMRQQSDEVSSNRSGSNNEEEEEDFFSDVTQPKESSRTHRSLKGKAQNLIKTWLETNYKDKDLLTDAAFLGEQVLVDLFIKFNTAVPSSAAVERLFSMEKDILGSKRSSLSDQNFDMLIFMKGNMHLMDKMENEKNLIPPLNHSFLS